MTPRATSMYTFATLTVMWTMEFEHSINYFGREDTRIQASKHNTHTHT